MGLILQKKKKRKTGTWFGNDTEGKGKGKQVLHVMAPAYYIDHDLIVYFLPFFSAKAQTLLSRVAFRVFSMSPLLYIHWSTPDFSCSQGFGGLPEPFRDVLWRMQVTHKCELHPGQVGSSLQSHIKRQITIHTHIYRKFSSQFAWHACFWTVRVPTQTQIEKKEKLKN